MQRFDDAVALFVNVRVPGRTPNTVALVAYEMSKPVDLAISRDPDALDAMLASLRYQIFGRGTRLGGGE